MLLKKHAEIMIKNKPLEVWDFASNPENWSASNPEEHFGLIIDSINKRPETGATFIQKEKIAGIFAELKGLFYSLKNQKLQFGGA